MEAPGKEEDTHAVVEGEGNGNGGSEGGTSVLVHLLKDTPPFAGEDGRTYSLKKGDVVTLPHKLADVLLSRGMAEEVQQGD